MPLSPRQLSLFGVEAAPPVPMDLAGLLAGAGQVTRMGGTARVSVVVDERWRAAVLLAECAQRAVAASCESTTVEGHLVVRTAYSTVLAPLGRRWLAGAIKGPPADLYLDGRQLRLWYAAGGSPDGAQACALRLGVNDSEATWNAVGAALAGLGLPAVLLGPRAGGPAYRIVGRRRLGRLRELVGEAPAQAPPGAWPT